jgi:cyclopropane-fatty-acyl-phospholipid synthase
MMVARRIAYAALERLRVGSLTVVEDGSRRVFGSGPPAATVHVRSPRVWALLLLRGSRGLAASYADRLWESPDLVALIRLAARNVETLDSMRARVAPLRIPIERARAHLVPNTPARSRRDIAGHYDLGNELFSQILDPTMTYSCAVFERPGMTLEDAQVAKYERACEKLDLGSADRVLEIGTGWGGFAVHATSTRGCSVTTTTTISREQRSHALGSVRRAGVSGSVEVLLEDYRHLRGRYDKLVSIEMIEAVGWRDYARFFGTCSKLLEPDGAMLLQAITIDDRAYEVEKAGKSFINTYIFPNGCLPSLEVISREIARRTDMQTVHLEDLTAHYVETLRRWRQRFAANSAALERLGYDERFRRLWTLYLAYCEAGFAERRICEVQMLFAKPLRRSAATMARVSGAGRGLSDAARA